MPRSHSIATNWYETTCVTNSGYLSLSFDLDVDVCVIGGGLAGLTVARELALHGWSVAVLEAGKIAHAASGRNTGFVLPGFDAPEEKIIERVGLDCAKQLWALSEQGLHYMRETIAHTKMPGIAPSPGWLHICKTDDDQALRAHVERLRWLGADVEFWPTDRVRTVLPSSRYFSAVHYPNAFHIHPLNYALGLASSAVNAGARIFEQTPAISIDPVGIRKRIETPKARVRASHIVLAGNVSIGSLMPRLGATLMPITTFILVTEPISHLNEVIRYHGAISDTNRTDNHYRIIDGDRLQWAGRLRTWQADPLKQRQSLLADIRRNFPALGSVKAAHIWCGTFGNTIHRMPQIGEIAQGLWIVSGFGGHGLNTTAMAGELITRAIIERDQTWRLFTPFELVWAGGMLGRMLIQGGYWASRPMELICEALARRRERKRTRRWLKRGYKKSLSRR